jgi:hypothetical protein
LVRPTTSLLEAHCLEEETVINQEKEEITQFVRPGIAKLYRGEIKGMEVKENFNWMCSG